MELISNPYDKKIKDLQRWSLRYQKVSEVVYYVTFFDMIILLLTSSITFFLVIYQRKTRDLFAVISLTSYILASASLSIFTFVKFSKVQQDPPEQVGQYLVSIEAFGKFCYLIAHWAFSSQYLKTSFVLPSLLKQANLEFKYHDGSYDNRPSDCLDTTSISLLKEVDDQLHKEKKFLSKIKIRMIIYNTVMTLMIGALSIFDYNKKDWIGDEDNAQIYERAFYFGLLLLNTLILTWSVVVIRQMLRSLHNAFPNEKFIGIHVLNSCIYTFLFFVLTIVLILRSKKQIIVDCCYSIEIADEFEKILFFYQVIYIILLAFQLYMDIFLLYVISRFTKLTDRGTEQDEVLCR